MNKPSPLEILMKEFLPAEQVADMEAEVKKIKEPPVVTALAALKTPIYGNDPNELLKHRFLYRGAICLVCGPTGIGKSSFLIQAAMHWAVGKAFFGMEPGDVFQKRGMRILIVQAENDEGDLAEMRNGVLAGCDVLSDDEKRRAAHTVEVCTINDKSAGAFTEVLAYLLTTCGPYDMVIVDPAFAYLGGESNSQKDVSHFMRELLNPLVQKHGVGLILAHHTNKPLRGREKESWEAGDFAYLGAGSAEWINPARSAVALRSIGSDSIFELRAVKRGKRLRWLDEEGLPTMAQYIAHDREPGRICWRAATPEEIAAVLEKNPGGRRRCQDAFECVHAVSCRGGESQKFYLTLMAGALECSTESIRAMMKKCINAGWLVERMDGHSKRYEVTAQGREELAKHPSPRDWRNQ